MDEIETKIREYAQRRNKNTLKTYVGNLDNSQIVDLIKTKLNDANFVSLWDSLMQSFEDTPECHEKRYNMVVFVLHKFSQIECCISRNVTSAILTRLCIELPKFQTQHLRELCTMCVECIQKGQAQKPWWKEVLPEALTVIVDAPCVHHFGQDITGFEYKTELISSLCMMTWSADIIATLTSMFIEMPLTSEEHMQVVTRLGQHLEKLTLQEVPPFVYQMLNLCQNQNSQHLFIRLQNYFSTRIYLRLQLSEDSSMDTPDLETIESACHQEAVDIESTVLFHIYKAASLGYDSIKNDYLNSLKNLTAPDIILHPFSLTVLLTLFTIPIYYKEGILKILKSSISKFVQEEHKKSHWFREMVLSDYKLQETLSIVMDCSIKDRYLVVEGLVELAYVLLGVGAQLGRDGDPVAETQWHLGKTIIIRVIKKKRQIAPCVISTLNKQILSGHNVFQYVECIRSLCQNMPLTMLDNQGSIIELIDYLDGVPAPVATQIFDAVLPLIKMSTTIKDHLILLLKKALHSNVTETRRMAVVGFLKLIQKLKISNLASLSQSTSQSSQTSNYSLSTYASLTSCRAVTKSISSVFSNESICLEVLDILRRCFMQQVEVKSQLYDGLYDAVCMNPELGIPVLDMIWLHFVNIYKSDEEALPPFDIKKIYVNRYNDIKFDEPVGKLVYAIGLILCKVKEENNTNPTVKKFTDTLDSFCKRMIESEIINFELHECIDLSDTSTETRAKFMVLNETLKIYEALIGYKICSWSLDSESNAKDIHDLFQGYVRFSNLFKTLTKLKKSGKQKKADDTNKTTQQSPNTTKASQKSTGGGKKTVFKLPDTVLDFQAIGKMLHLLHKIEVDWTSAENSSIIKSNKDIHQHMMQVTINLVQKLKNSKGTTIKHSEPYFNYITEIAGILYERCIIRIFDFVNFDKTTALLAAECFHLILTVICLHYQKKLGVFLNLVGGKSKDTVFSISISSFVETYKSLFNVENIKEETDADMKKLYLTLIDTLTLFVSHIPPMGTTGSSQLLEWLKSTANEYTFGSQKQLAAKFLHLTLTTQIKFRNSLSFFETVAARLNSVFGMVVDQQNTEEENPKLIDDAVALNVYPILCNVIKGLLDDVDWVVTRLKAEYAVIMYPGDFDITRKMEKLKNKERGVCCHLCPIITIVGIMTNTTIPIGPLLDSLLKLISHLYCTLNSLTKYFIMRSSKLNIVFQGARFEHVVKLSGKMLSGYVYDLIIYVHESQKQEVQTVAQNKKQINSTTMKNKVLHQTRLIPKVIYDLEQYDKSIIQLSKKTKVDLSKFVGMGKVRDFRIKDIKGVLEKLPDYHTSQEDRSSEIVSDDETVGENEVIDKSESSDEEKDEPPKKKKKV